MCTSPRGVDRVDRAPNGSVFWLAGICSLIPFRLSEPRNSLRAGTCAHTDRAQARGGPPVSTSKHYTDRGERGQSKEDQQSLVCSDPQGRSCRLATLGKAQHAGARRNNSDSACSSDRRARRTAGDLSERRSGRRAARSLTLLPRTATMHACGNGPRRRGCQTPSNARRVPWLSESHCLEAVSIPFITAT